MPVAVSVDVPLLLRGCALCIGKRQPVIEVHSALRLTRRS
jgi:hypothetical protein